MQDFLKKLVEKPGVYLMFNSECRVIYVGKAKNLKKRVSSYFNREHGQSKTGLLVNQIDHIEVTVTATESEALLLENSLIKQHKPRYNIIFRDDKTYPYLHLTQSDFPQLLTYRGRVKKTGHTFGPYPNVASTREMQKILQKIFKLRDCPDAIFLNRARPCLQYQMGRCSAPCVGLISKQDYQDQIHWAKLFLEGKNQAVLKSLGQKMQIASDQLAYELALKFRDQINLLSQLQKDQSVQTKLSLDADILGLAKELDRVVISVLSVKQGRVLGSRSFNQKVSLEAWDNEDLEQELIQRFIEQIYLLPDLCEEGTPKKTKKTQKTKKLDELILPSGIKLDLMDFSLDMLPFKILTSPRGVKRHWVEMASTNAKAQLAMVLAGHEQGEKKFERLRIALNFPHEINRLECVDISHHQGESTVASCVVFNSEGPDKSAYRKFNIENITAGDDYAAIYQVVTRRFKRLLEEGGDFPDLFLIDGGQQQLAKAQQALLDLNIQGVRLIAISKGPDRKVGLEQLWEVDQPLSKRLNPEDPALHLIQHIRDESHRFAIEGHRAKKAKKRSESRLEDLPGIGPKRRRALLNHFGSLEQVLNSSVDELCKVEGISRALAMKILGEL